MQLGELMTRLAHIELKNLSMVEARAITPESRGEVITAINEGLTRLYSRYPFKEKTLLIEQVMNITEYKMHPKYAFSRRNTNNELHHFIMDSASEPYTGDLIKIISVWDDEGRQLTLNDISNPYSLFTPYPDTLLIQRPDEGQVVSLTYQAMPDEIPGNAPDTYEFDLPKVLKGALAAFTGHQIFTSIGTQEAILKGQTLLGTFEAQCLETQLGDNLSTTITGSGQKFHERGFV